jgi:membrane associated rhomboid family serine protease
MKNKKINYDFHLKKEEIQKIFNTTDYSEYKEKKIKNQARKEKIYKFTSIGNSTNTVRNLIIANIIFFIISLFLPFIMTDFALYNISDSNFKAYQILTSMFLHGGFIHLGFNMFMLWSFGNQIEQIVGLNKFIKLYFISGITSGILWMLLGTGPAVGASGALCGLLAAYIFISPEAKVMMFFIIPMKIKSAVYGFGAFSLIFGLLSLINPTYGFGIGHFAHLGGLIGGYLLTLYWKEKSLIPTF